VLALPRDRSGGGGREAPAGAARRAARVRGLARHGRLHSEARDRAAVRFHYDVGNDFYALWLDRDLVYSCAYFETGSEGIDEAQAAKLDYLCRKLRLRAGERLLDIGCGWGALVRHAARHYGVDALGITLSEPQAALARERIRAEGLADRCRVEVRDYRELDEPAGFDKVVSVGMVEHVGAERLRDYFAAAHRVLRPGGLFLNHGIVSVVDARPATRLTALARRLWRRDEFIRKYVFPDGRLVPAAAVIAAAEAAGFETRDVESLREHYALTLRHWVRRLEGARAAAARLVGEEAFRVWRLYMAASAHSFASGRIAVLQTLLAKPDAEGRAGLPLTRRDLYVRDAHPGMERLLAWHRHD
jgi:cyclopropane-fatty-acyl-phospholipid synthase